MSAFAFNFGDENLGVPISIPGGGPIPIFGVPGISRQNTPTSLPGASGNGNNTGFSTYLQTGLGFAESILGYKLLSQQIKQNQYPSVSYDAQGRPTGVASVGLSGFGNFGIFLPILLVVIVLALLFKR